MDLESFLCSGAICSLNANELLVGWGGKTWLKNPLSYPIWYAPDFFLTTKTPYLHFEHTMKLSTDGLTFSHEKAGRISFDPPDWAVFENFLLEFKDSGLKKVVPYVQKRAVKNVTPSLLKALLQSCLTYQKANPTTGIYGFWDGSEGILGVTPELLLSVDEKGDLKSHACAGTAPVHQAAFMSGDAKLMNEHDLVIQGLKLALESCGEVSIGKTEVKAFAGLAHLITPVTVINIKNLQIDQIIACMHPTPALGAFPKDQGIPFLKKYALQMPRGRYGAPFGILESKNHALLYVAIRNVQWINDRMILTAGSGIVSESTLFGEKNEILAKFEAIEEILGLKV